MKQSQNKIEKKGNKWTFVSDTRFIRDISERTRFPTVLLELVHLMNP